MSLVAPRTIRFADLGPRLASGLALAAAALALVWAGGPWMAALAGLALTLMLWELHRMVTRDGRWHASALVAMVAAGLAAVAATATWGIVPGLACLAAGGALAIALGRGWAAWLAAGLVYMGVAACALVLLRGREPDGFWIVLWLVLVVVVADVGAYFAGRALGGPKLWPRVSPGKTWSGALGGLAAAGAVGLGFGLAMGWSAGGALVLGLGVGVASQLGDLLESALKRRFAVKDASRLIPGHGGVMDRLDGVMGGVWFFALCDALGLAALG